MQLKATHTIRAAHIYHMTEHTNIPRRSLVVFHLARWYLPLAPGVCLLCIIFHFVYFVTGTRVSVLAL